MQLLYACAMITFYDYSFSVYICVYSCGDDGTQNIQENSSYAQHSTMYTLNTTYITCHGGAGVPLAI